MQFLFSTLFFIGLFSCSGAEFLGAPSANKTSSTDSTRDSEAQEKESNNSGNDIIDESSDKRNFGENSGTSSFDLCDKPTGVSRNEVNITGEDFPNNPFDSGGFDNDDYQLVISGNVVVDGKKIGSNSATSLDISYSRLGSNCHHNFELVYRKCPNSQSKVYKKETFKIGGQSSFTKTIDLPKDVFVDISLHTSLCSYSGMNGLTANVNLFESEGQYFEIN